MTASISSTGLITANNFTESYPFIQTIGTPTISADGVVNNFSASNYLKLTEPFNPESDTWCISVKVRTGAVNVNNYVYGNFGNTYQNAPQAGVTSAAKWRMFLPTTNATAGINATGTYTVLADTVYWIRQYFDGSKYYFDYSLDGINYIRDITINNSTLLRTVAEGFNIAYNQWSATSTEYWRGSIYINTFQITRNNKVIPSIAKKQIRANIFYEV